MEEFFAKYGQLLFDGTIDTIVMTLVATIAAYVIGTPVGVLLTTTAPNGPPPRRTLSLASRMASRINARSCSVIFIMTRYFYFVS